MLNLMYYLKHSSLFFLSECQISQITPTPGDINFFRRIYSHLKLRPEGISYHFMVNHELRVSLVVSGYYYHDN